MIVGGVILNFIIFGVIVGVGLLLKIFIDYKYFERKIEMCKYVYIIYEKVLFDLRFCF